ncbi:11999_t:CDS:10 [Ambispora leptoticha]|uniref:11999_t:CDS:1 n=1 Tax=Ambispora leptoticha TaxID=144679 RepID=A0A9N8VIG9_9GLOM|nr:11999_t:CDS:10 [Ambispora leptoticha]
MAAPYRKVQPKQFPKPLTSYDAEAAAYWKKFKTPKYITETASVTSIHFSPVSPHDFAVTSSTRVQIYSSKTHKVEKTFARFKDTAYSGTIRNDGKLLLAGDATGCIQLFDINSRRILRTIHEHKLGNNGQILSCSDDKTVRVWDVPSQEAISIFSEHETLRLWDIRANKVVMNMNHGYPIESVLMFPGGGVVISAGGPIFTVWDIIGGGRVMRSVSNHQKTITSLCFDSSCSRLLTGSLDGHVKIYDVTNYKVVHGFKYEEPILSIALSPDDTILVTGMTSSQLGIRQRQIPVQEKSTTALNQGKRNFRGGSWAYFKRGEEYKDVEEDIIIEKKMSEGTGIPDYDQFLRYFQYSKALDSSLKVGVRAINTISLLLELVRRDGLRQALAERDDASLQPIIRFLTKNINNPRYTNLLVDVGNLIIDMYSTSYGLTPSPIIEEFKKLYKKVKSELDYQIELSRVLGSLEMIFVAAENAHSIHNNNSSIQTEDEIQV